MQETDKKHAIHITDVTPAAKGVWKLACDLRGMDQTDFFNWAWSDPRNLAEFLNSHADLLNRRATV